MKKFTLVAILMLSVVAMAGTLAVPFFNDMTDVDGTDNDNLRPASGDKFYSYIGIKNTTDAAMTVSIRYWAANGTEVTPDPNTFTIGAQQGLGFRPRAQQAGSENTTVPATSKANGSCLMTFVGNRGDLVGRCLIFDAVGQSAYLLPTGPEA